MTLVFKSTTFFLKKLNQICTTSKRHRSP